MEEKKKSNGILFESESHVMIEIVSNDLVSRATVPKSSISIETYYNDVDKESYSLRTDLGQLRIKKETYYALLDILFGSGTEARLKMMESAGVAKKVSSLPRINSGISAIPATTSVVYPSYSFPHVTTNRIGPGTSASNNHCPNPLSSGIAAQAPTMSPSTYPSGAIEMIKNWFAQSSK